MSKKNLHPKQNICPVYCDGIKITEILSTATSIEVDLWSGNHPFFTGKERLLDTEGRVDKFIKKYNLNNL